MHQQIIIQHQLVKAFERKYNVPVKYRVLGNTKFGGEFALDLQFTDADVSISMYYLPLKDQPYVKCFSVRSLIPPDVLDSHFYLKLRMLQKDLMGSMEFQMQDVMRV